MLVQSAFGNLRFADAPSQVAATTLMTHCVSQIATAFQPSDGNIWLAVAFLVAKLAKLNLKGLTTLCEMWLGDSSGCKLRDDQ